VLDKWIAFEAQVEVADRLDQKAEEDRRDEDDEEEKPRPLLDCGDSAKHVLPFPAVVPEP